MGYNIGIGNAVIEYIKDYDHLILTVEYTEHPDAPNHDIFVKKLNYRSPSYGGWHDFCRKAGIFELFYGKGKGARHDCCSEDFHRETPFLFDHPGIKPINEKDYEYIKNARIKYQKNNGNKEPGCWDKDPNTHEYIDNGKDPCLARLLWLEFWMRWALDNCEYPAIYNS